MFDLTNLKSNVKLRFELEIKCTLYSNLYETGQCFRKAEQKCLTILLEISLQSCLKSIENLRNFYIQM